MVYELMGIRNSTDPESSAPDDAERLCEMTRAASDLFEQGRLDEAAEHYRNISLAFPDDPVAKSMLAICAAARGPGA